MRRIDHSDRGVRWCQGHLYAEYDEIVQVLGDPTCMPDDGVDLAWEIEEGESIFVLYSGVPYCLGAYGELTLDDLHRWHIGGYDRGVVFAVKTLFPNHAVDVVQVSRVRDDGELDPVI